MASRYEKMEVMLEEIMQEPSIDAKIDEMKSELKEPSQVGGSDRSEYRKNLQNQKQKNKEIEKKLVFYEAYKKNKDQIFNIREYQLELQKELEVLEKERREDRKIVKEYEDNEKQIKDLDTRLEKMQKEIEEIDEKLKQDDLSEIEAEKLQSRKKDLRTKIDDQSVSYQFALRKKLEFENSDVKDMSDKLDKISENIKANKIQISKCNAVWSSLLKGKSWDEIQVILERGDFTAEKGTINKIKDLKASHDKIQDEKSKDGKIKGISNNIKNLINKTKNKDEEEYVDGNRLQGNNGEEINGDLSEEELEESFFEKHPKLAQMPHLKKIEENEKAGNLPVEVKSFTEKHPTLAKIPFLAKIMDKINKNKVMKVNNNNQNEQNTETTNSYDTNIKNENNSGITEKDLKYIAKQMEKDEIATFKRIAESGPKGFRESMRTEAQDRYNKQKEEAADGYAKKYSNSRQYQQQAEDIRKQNDGPEIGE